MRGLLIYKGQGLGSQRVGQSLPRTAVAELGHTPLVQPPNCRLQQQLKPYLCFNRHTHTHTHHVMLCSGDGTGAGAAAPCTETTITQWKFEWGTEQQLKQESTACPLVVYTASSSDACVRCLVYSNNTNNVNTTQEIWTWAGCY